MLRDRAGTNRDAEEGGKKGESTWKRFSESDIIKRCHLEKERNGSVCFGL